MVLLFAVVLTRGVGIARWPHRKLHYLRRKVEDYQKLKETNPEAAKDCDSHIVMLQAAVDDILNGNLKSGSFD